MTGYSAYQSSCFQNNAYQIARAILKKGGGGRTHDYIGAQETFKRTYQEEQRRLQEERAKAEKLLAAKEVEISKIEAKRLEALADKALQIRLMMLLKQLQELQDQKAELERLIQFWISEEDDLLAILYSLPFMA